MSIERAEVRVGFLVITQAEEAKAIVSAVARIDALKKTHSTEDLARIWPAAQDEVTSAPSKKSQAHKVD